MPFMVGSIEARLQLDSGGYTRGMLNAQSMNAVFGQSVTNFINNPLLGTIGIIKAAITTVGRWSLEVLSNAEAVARLADQTGLTTDTVQALRAEFELAGRATTQADQAFRTFNTRLQQARDQGGPVADLFARIGVSIDSMRGTDEVFGEVLARIGEFEDVAKSGAIAAQLFGEEAGGAVAETVRAGGGLEGIISKFRDLGRVTDEEGIRKMAEYNTRLGELQQAALGVRQALTTDFLGVLFEDLENMDTDELREFIRLLRDDLKPTIEGLAVAIKGISSGVRGFQDFFDPVSDVVANAISPQPNSPGTRFEINAELQRLRRESEERRGLRQANRDYALDQVIAGR